jgi:twinkle protein
VSEQESNSDFISRGPCDACGSSDANALYDDGHTHCFSCGKTVQGEKVNAIDMVHQTPAAKGFKTFDPMQFVVEPLTDRAISLATCQKYSYGKLIVHPERHVMPYYDDKGVLVAQKIRFPDKTFTWLGDVKGAALFGQRLWSNGTKERPAKRVIVTEGEIDALSLAQALNLKWAVVSVKNGAKGAKKDLAAQLTWLEGFEQVVLMFDMDKPGQDAARECAELFTPGKCALATLPLKDANDMVRAGRTEELVRAVWEAKTFRPDGIVAGVDLIERVLQPPPPSTPYPWAPLDTILRGMRMGEIVTWCGGTGGGKSQVIRELVSSLRRGGSPVGVIALEESVVRAAMHQVSLELQCRLHDPQVRAKVSDEHIRKAAEVALKDVHFFEHFGSVETEIILPRIRYMAKALGVKWVVLDHISIMISGTATDGDERKRIDELMTKLRTLVEELQIGVHIVSHLRKASGTPHEEGGRITMDDLRGSGAIKQVSDNIVALERNQQAEDPKERNRTLLRVLKCRLFGETGLAGVLMYDNETGRITETAMPAFSPVKGGDDVDF